MHDTLSTGEAASLLTTTPPTIRDLLVRGELEGERQPRGKGFCWRVYPDSVTQFLDQHGPFNGRRRTSRDRQQLTEEAVRDLRGQLEELRELVDGRASPNEGLKHLQRERDDLRATVVTLKELLTRSRTVAELQERAEAERAAVAEHLVEAVSAGERADMLRRSALEELAEAVAAAFRAGHAGDLRP